MSGPRRLEARSWLCAVAAALGVTAASSVARAAPAPLTLMQVLARAEQSSPALNGARQAEEAASQEIRAQLSAYYPDLGVAAVGSMGFPASAGAPAGFNGVSVSPFREGWSYDAFATLSIFDLSRELGVRAARYRYDASREETEADRVRLDLQAMNLYLDAVLARKEQTIWTDMRGVIDRLNGLVGKLVRNGQYSEVTSWLLKVQDERAAARAEGFRVALASARSQLEALLGAEPGTVDVASEDSLDAVLRALPTKSAVESPLVSAPRLEARTASAVVDLRNAENFPRLLGAASAGQMADARLVPEQNYAAWIGITLPIFEGFRVEAEVSAARAEAERSADSIGQAQLDLRITDDQYAARAETGEIEVRHLEAQVQYATRALELAEKRYRIFTGGLADVRDSLAAYEEALSSRETARIDLARAQLARALVDGITLNRD